MTRYRFKPRLDRDFRFLPCDNLESLVCSGGILCRWLRRFPSNEGVKEGCLPKKSLILPLLTHLVWERLQIDTDLLLTSFPRVPALMTLNDLEHISRVNCAAITEDRQGQPAYEIFSCVNFNSQSFDTLFSMSHPYECIKFGYPLQNVLFLLPSSNLAWERYQLDTDLLLIISTKTKTSCVWY